MTTVAYDGKMFAADRLATIGNLKTTVRKIFRCGRFLYGTVGKTTDNAWCREWLERGAKLGDWPDIQIEDTIHGLAVEVRTGHVFIVSGDRPAMSKIEDSFIAMGSGSDFAIAAMEIGKTAAEAVEIAAKYDAGTGHGVDFVMVKKPKATRRKAKR